MEPFKEIFNKTSITELAIHVRKQYPKFESNSFLNSVLQKLDQKELKQRVESIATTLNQYLTGDYAKDVEILVGTLAPEISPDDEFGEGVQGFMVWPLTTYVETYGLDHFEISMQALYAMTKRFSSEFAIRRFISKYDEDVYRLLRVWKKDPSHHVRRLVSEGTRPRLPWGIKVDSINTKLKRNITLINSLRKDPSLYVRRSVANHLNDISYLDEKLFFDTLNKFGESSYENYVKRHASRSLLKKGHKKALQLHGYQTKHQIQMSLKLETKKLKEGEKLNFSVKTSFNGSKKLLVEYLIHYLKKDGSYSIKAFRLRDLVAKDGLEIEKSHHFKRVTTRKHYPGWHFIQIQINGKTYPKQKFMLSIDAQ